MTMPPRFRIEDVLLVDHSFVFAERQTFQVQGHITETAKLVAVWIEAMSGPVEMALLQRFKPAREPHSVMGSSPAAP
jgi:hypothetical protein